MSVPISSFSSARHRKFIASIARMTGRFASRPRSTSAIGVCCVLFVLFALVTLNRIISREGSEGQKGIHQNLAGLHVFRSAGVPPALLRDLELSKLPAGRRRYNFLPSSDHADATLRISGARFELTSVAAREPQDERGRIRTEVSLVSVLASVLDANGHPATGLTADQFDVYEEGNKQKIEIFEPETQQPLDLTLMIDSSLSEVKELEFEEDAASRFIQKLVRPGDRLALFEFSDTVTQLAAFTSNVPTLQAALKRILPGDGTALYDAVYLGAETLGRATAGRRRVIVLVTDAGETTSRADFETARRAALRADALLYTIVVRAVKNESGRNTAGEHALETIADSTGGATYFPNEIGELGAMFDRIDRELRTQYRLAYYPDPRPPAGEYRTLEVRVKCDCKVRSRKAYYSGGHLE